LWWWVFGIVVGSLHFFIKFWNFGGLLCYLLCCGGRGGGGGGLCEVPFDLFIFNNDFSWNLDHTPMIVLSSVTNIEKKKA